MLQWTVVALVVLVCAVHVAWTVLPSAWQRRWRARIGPAQRQTDAPGRGSSACDRCSGCSSGPGAEANQPKVICVVPRG